MLSSCLDEDEMRYLNVPVQGSGARRRVRGSTPWRTGGCTLVQEKQLEVVVLTLDVDHLPRGIAGVDVQGREGLTSAPGTGDELACC